MQELSESNFLSALSSRLTEDARIIADKWLEKLDEIIDERTRDIFPTELLLDHIPSLVEELARVIDAPEDAVAASSSLIARKAQELGNLRHEQDATVHQILREYDLLAQILEEFLCEEVERLSDGVSVQVVLSAFATMQRVVRMILQSTVDAFAEKYVAQIEQQRETLISFNNFVSHELKKPLQAALLNSELLLEDKSIAHDDIQALLSVKNGIQQAASVLRSIEDLANFKNFDTGNPVTNEIEIGTLVNDISMQLEDMLEHYQVELKADEEIAVVETIVAKLELVLTNIITNAIKYSDPKKQTRTVKVSASNEAAKDMIRIDIEDNGIGIAEHMREDVFQLRFRGEESADVAAVSGNGLGLFLAREAIEALGGVIELASETGTGTTFSIYVPKVRN